MKSKTITITASKDAEKKLLKLLSEIQKCAAVGHSFYVVIDPKKDPSKTEPHIYWDGDGWDKIFQISSAEEK